VPQNAERRHNWNGVSVGRALQHHKRGNHVIPIQFFFPATLRHDRHRLYDTVTATIVIIAKRMCCAGFASFWNCGSEA